MRACAVPTARALACAALLACASCFVDEGDCVSEGVSVEPCTQSLNVGGSIELTAAVVAEPALTVEWSWPPEAEDSFAITVDGNRLGLVGLTGIANVNTFVARHPDDPNRFGQAVLAVGVPSYGYPSSPVTIGNTDFPDDQKGAVAAGGGFLYGAYADPDSIPPLGAAPAFGFVRQIRLADGLVREVADQFLLLASGGPQTVAPNIAADCQGQGYWIDRPVAGGPLVLFRLRTNGALESQSLDAQFASVRAIAVTCSGRIYLILTDVQGFAELFVASSFGQAPVPFPVPGFPGAGQVTDCLAVDAQERLLLGDENPDGNAPITRVLADGTVDASFDTSSLFVGVSALAVDAQGVVHAAARNFSLPDSILHLNAFGTALGEVLEYQYVCPTGCATPDCGSFLPFENLVSIGALANGGLIVADEVAIQPGLPDACRVSVRYILLSL